MSEIESNFLKEIADLAEKRGIKSIIAIVSTTEVEIPKDTGDFQLDLEFSSLLHGNAIVLASLMDSFLSDETHLTNLMIKIHHTKMVQKTLKQSNN